MTPRVRLALAVAAGWLIAGTLWGAQTALGSALSGGQPTTVSAEVRSALMQTIPWIPITLVVIALTTRFPLTRATWRSTILVHVGAALAMAFVANVLVVIAYQITVGRMISPAMLAREGATWMAVRFHVALVIYAAVAAATQTVMNYRLARATELRSSQLETQLARARLDALNAQIRPHFLFNTMHTIGQLWRSGRSEDAERMLDSLGSLFHRVQHSTSNAEVTLEEELSLVRDYLAIEGVRFRDRLSPVIDVPPDLMSARVPPLVLQPLVENAIRHGISARASARLVEVRAKRDGGTLTLTVHDDGPGPNGGSAQRGSGTGLANIRARLAHLYGAKGRLDIAEGATTGTVVTLRLPYSTDAAPVA